MRKGTKVKINWPRVYPPTEGKIKSIDKENGTARVFTMGGVTEFPTDKLERL